MGVAEANMAASPRGRNRNGCSILGKVFGKRRKHGPLVGAGISKHRGSITEISRRRKAGKSDEASFLPTDHPKASSDEKNVVVQMKPIPPNAEANITDQIETVPRNPNTSANDFIEKKSSGEMISPATNGSTVKSKPSAHKGNILVRASSKVMVLAHLGNIKQASTPTYNKIHRALSRPNANAAAYAAAADAAEAICFDQKNRGYGNVVPSNNKNTNKANDQNKIESHGSETGEKVLCRALSTRADPEDLKAAGNEEYRDGRFAEALALYDQAIFLAPDKAAYHCNKSAALIGLGRLLDAVSVCKEAIRLEPTYARAHRRLAILYFRLGIAEKSLNHHKQSGNESDPAEVEQAQALQIRLTKCTEVKKQRDYHTLLKETTLAIAAGADVAPYLFACQAEALMKLNRHEEADNLLSNGPQFGVEAVTEVFGTVSNAYFLMVRAQVDLASGRFESAVSTAQLAVNLDPSNKEVGAFVRKARAITMARSTGNELFKASKFSEAYTEYSEGLKQEPMNAILLCNRAACRSKLGQWEKAVEDCSAALKFRPNYTKARLRRADCNAKLERWEAAIEDYEVLMQQSPDDRELGQFLSNARLQLKKQRGEDHKDNQAAELISVSSIQQFKQFLESPGVCVVLFCTKSSDQSDQIIPFAQQLPKRYPSVYFLKVDIEESPSLAESECVSTIQAFKIYKDGNRVKDIDETNLELLESSVKYFST